MTGGFNGSPAGNPLIPVRQHSLPWGAQSFPQVPQLGLVLLSTQPLAHRICPVWQSMTVVEQTPLGEHVMVAGHAVHIWPHAAFVIGHTQECAGPHTKFGPKGAAVQSTLHCTPHAVFDSAHALETQPVAPHFVPAGQG